MTSQPATSHYKTGTRSWHLWNVGVRDGGVTVRWHEDGCAWFKLGHTARQSFKFKFHISVHGICIAVQKKNWEKGEALLRLLSCRPSDWICAWLEALSWSYPTRCNQQPWPITRNNSSPCLVQIVTRLFRITDKNLRKRGYMQHWNKKPVLICAPVYRERCTRTIKNVRYCGPLACA